MSQNPCEGPECTSKSRHESVETRLATLYNYSLGLLARREHSRLELQQKLARRSADSDDSDMIEAVLDKLAERGLQSDQRFAEAYVRMRARKGFGPARITRELGEKGINPETADCCVDDCGDWYDRMEQAWRKKFGRPPVTHADKARQIRFLLYRGYGMDAIQALLRSI